MEQKLTHFDEKGGAVMVDVTEKAATQREALAKGRIRMNREAFEAVRSGTAKKGDVLGVARIAGIMAAKRTSDIIPLCHPLLLTKCAVDFELDEKDCTVTASCLVRVKGETGVEMEALTAVSVAALTIYDMCKSINKRMVLSEIHLLEKTGGKSGTFRFETEENT